MPGSEFDPGNLGPEFQKRLEKGFDTIFAGIVEHFDVDGRPGALSYSQVDDVQRPLPDEVEWGTPRSQYPDGNYGDDFPLESGNFD
ncbi:hypothetical protein A3D14_03095 [Candidatus Saccharibacteria bacterium RIFCSPHIGHO2_02_FULL_47_12]|nr:MAG: hypothetical protein A3D14_03095 [Candidatus Saccharibacteria bacterium RIFCSPHIGHO2_02_FULL_47_12]